MSHLCEKKVCEVLPSVPNTIAYSYVEFWILTETQELWIHFEVLGVGLACA